jgi:hypothetical protein
MPTQSRIGPALLSLIVAVAAAGCSSITGVRADTRVTVTSSPSAPVPVSVTSAPVTSVVVDSFTVASTYAEPATALPTEYVNNCMAYVQFGAATDNWILSSMWNDAGQNVQALALMCEALGITNPDVFVGMTEQWIDIETFLAAAPPPTSTPASDHPVPGNTTHAPPPTVEPPHIASQCDPNYTGCVLPSSDVDCLGEGDGPVFLSEVVGVIGDDIYDLDADGNRIACG